MEKLLTIFLYVLQYNSIPYYNKFFHFFAFSCGQVINSSNQKDFGIGHGHGFLIPENSISCLYNDSQKHESSCLLSGSFSVGWAKAGIAIVRDP